MVTGATSLSLTRPAGISALQTFLVESVFAPEFLTQSVCDFPKPQYLQEKFMK